MRVERPLQICDGRVTADGGHVAFVKIVELLSRAPGQIVPDGPRSKISHLHRRLRHTWHPLAILFDVGEISEDEDIFMTGRIQELVHNDTTLVVYGQT